MPSQTTAAGRAQRLVVGLTAAAGLAGCASSVPAGSSPAHATPSAPGSARRPAPSKPPTAVVTLASCAAAVDAGALHVVHHFAVSPDDIAIDAGGRLWVSAVQANLVFSLNPDGSGIAAQTVAGGPEGLAIDASTTYVAQQRLNAIATIAPARGTLITFPNRTANAGIDGIAINTAARLLLVPDSPAGELFAVPLTGPLTPRLIATNLGRPVAAAVDSTGDVFVASESSPGLVMLTPTGTRRTLGRFTDLDEVVAYAGLLYVTELDHHDVVAVDPTSEASHPIAVDLPAPQGLAVTATGTLEIVDATTDTLYSMPACGAGP